MKTRDTKLYKPLRSLLAVILIAVLGTGVTYGMHWSTAVVNEIYGQTDAPPPVDPPPTDPPPTDLPPADLPPADLPPTDPPTTDLPPLSPEDPIETDDIGEQLTPGGGLQPDPGDLPKTGDENDPAFWLILIAVSATALRQEMFFRKYRMRGNAHTNRDTR